MLHNVLKRFQFWRVNYPYGIFDINIEDLIDLDEAGFFLESVNRARGKACIGKRVSASELRRKGLTAILRSGP
jgi:hypothetical protein